MISFMKMFGAGLFIVGMLSYAGGHIDIFELAIAVVIGIALAIIPE